MISHFIRYSTQAQINLMSAKLRTGLAVLGVVVGTAAIVALIGTSQLATEKALEQFKALGTHLIAVSIFNQSSLHANTTSDIISLQSWYKLSSSLPNVKNIAPYNTAYQQVSFQGHDVKAVLIGADESLADILHIKLAEGRFLSFMTSFERFCVIGSALARDLKRVNLNSPIGMRIRVGSVLYTIIGIAAPWKGNVFFNEDVNQSVILPIAGIALINKNTQINNAIMLLKSDKDIDVTIAQIKNVIKMHAPNSNMFIRSAKQIIESMESQGKIFTVLLGVIGGIALFVGGIGVMNVMLVAVNERKKEIGIRKAIGAKNHEIQLLFLIESIILSLFGGIIGVVIGELFTVSSAYFNQWTFTYHVVPVVIGFSVSVITGIFFGFYPATRAANLEPMESLRSS